MLVGEGHWLAELGGMGYLGRVGCSQLGVMGVGYGWRRKGGNGEDGHLGVTVVWQPGVRTWVAVQGL